MKYTLKFLITKIDFGKIPYKEKKEHFQTLTSLGFKTTEKAESMGYIMVSECMPRIRPAFFVNQDHHAILIDYYKKQKIEEKKEQIKINKRISKNKIICDKIIAETKLEAVKTFCLENLEAKNYLSLCEDFIKRYKVPEPEVKEPSKDMNYVNNQKEIIKRYILEKKIHKGLFVVNYKGYCITKPFHEKEIINRGVDESYNHMEKKIISLDEKYHLFDRINFQLQLNGEAYKVMGYLNRDQNQLYFKINNQLKILLPDVITKEIWNELLKLTDARLLRKIKKKAISCGNIILKYSNDIVNVIHREINTQIQLRKKQKNKIIEERLIKENIEYVNKNERLYQIIKYPNECTLLFELKGSEFEEILFCDKEIIRMYRDVFKSKDYSNIVIDNCFSTIGDIEHQIETIHFGNLTQKFTNDLSLLFENYYMKKTVIFYAGLTNSGKTYSALNELVKHDNGQYLCPLRLLALEGQSEIEDRGHLCSFVTGEEQDIKIQAKFKSATIETYDHTQYSDCIVIDEIQMLFSDRGFAWLNALLNGNTNKIILTGAPSAIPIIKKICDEINADLQVHELERKTNLKAIKKGKQFPDNTAIIAFSRKEILMMKQHYGNDASVVYGNLSPEIRKQEAMKFREGKTKILLATDAIAMGLNLPIKHVHFSSLRKFDGKETRSLTDEEIRQIAGRAGRFNLFDEGTVSAWGMNTNELNTILQQSDSPPDVINMGLNELLLDKFKPISRSLIDLIQKFEYFIEKSPTLFYKPSDIVLELARIIPLKWDARQIIKFLNAPLKKENVHWYIQIIKEFKETKEISLKFTQPKNKIKSVSDLDVYETAINQLDVLFYLTRNEFLLTQKEQLEKEIIKFLNGNRIVFRCSSCNKEISGEHKMCEECFRKNRSYYWE